MKIRAILLPILLFFSLGLIAQCVECNSIDEAMIEPLKVKELIINPYLGAEPLHEIPSSVFELKNLEVLFLTDQNLTSIPNEIGALKKLKEISFAGSPLKDLPEELFDLPKLKELILFSCEFDESYKKQLKKRMKKEMPKTKLLID